MKRGLPWLVRVALSAAFLALLMSWLPTGQLASSLRHMSPTIWLTCLVGFLAGHVVAALKWRHLMLTGGDVSVASALQAHFVGQLATMFVPGLLGGDFFRAAFAFRNRVDAPAIAVAGLVDRLVDTAALILLCAIGVAGTAGQMSHPRDLLLASTGFLALAVLGLIVLGSVARRWVPSAWSRRFGALLGTLARDWPRVLFCLALSILVQGSFVVLNAWMSWQVGVELSIWPWLAAWPAAKLIAVLPISLGGVGVRESILVALLSPMGASAGSVTAAGLLWTSLLFIGGLVGGGIALLSTRLNVTPATKSVS